MVVVGCWWYDLSKFGAAMAEARVKGIPFTFDLVFEHLARMEGGIVSGFDAVGFTTKSCKVDGGGTFDGDLIV